MDALKRRVAALVLVSLSFILFLSGCETPKPEPSPPPVATTPAPVVAPSRPSHLLSQDQRFGYEAGFIAKDRSSAPSIAPYPYYPPIFASVDRHPDAQPSSILNVAEHPVSTFSIDVDTASYAFVRRQLTEGRQLNPGAVRVEEMVNYFPYDYPAPADRAEPFRVTTTLMPNPWRADSQLLHIALRGYDINRNERPRTNVVLLIDTSGSMSPQDRLPLLKQALTPFVQQLRAQDRVAIVTYAGMSQTVLEPTLGTEREKILDALERLSSGGSTAGGEGLQKAYALAERHFDESAVNRVILATDGDFNVGITDPKALERFIADKRKTGIYLSIFGVGVGNLNDALMQRLAQAGNGNAAYIDSLLEARKALDEQLNSTLFPIADDVKIQVEFNPRHVEAYRLIGYETRALKREDFKDDKVDAGDIGAGHTVTALYELLPAGTGRVDPLRYRENAQKEEGRAKSNYGADELAYVKLRYKLPGQPTSRLIERPVLKSESIASLQNIPMEQRFAVAVAAFGQRLRGETALQEFDYGKIAALADDARGKDPEGYRSEFLRLVRLAESQKSATPKK